MVLMCLLAGLVKQHVNVFHVLTSSVLFALKKHREEHELVLRLVKHNKDLQSKLSDLISAFNQKQVSDQKLVDAVSRASDPNSFYLELDIR